MNVTLTPELEAIVAEKIESGMYNSASEMVREALLLLNEQDEFRRMRLEELRREIAIGITASEHGNVKSYDAESLKAKFEEIKARGRVKLAVSQGE